MSDMSIEAETIIPEKRPSKAKENVSFIAGNISRTFTYFLGLIALVFGGAVAITDTSVSEIANWAENILGLGFIGLLALLITGSIYSLINMTRNKNNVACNVWLETGLNLSGGITTLALTFTLLGISLGIGGLAEQELTPDTVQNVIRDLTAQFSLAFMTTVIGLPTAALLRGALLITHARLISEQLQSK